MTTPRAALLRDVASAIIASGYAVPLKRPHTWRATQIAELAEDNRLDCSPRSAGSVALTETVMHRYGVKRDNAYRMVRRARKMREENDGRV